jgi:TolB-like protein
MTLYRKIQTGLLGLLLLSVLLSCRGGYSFTNTAISPDIKTVSIDYFQNMAPQVMPTLSNTFTEALITKFRRQTKLTFVEYDADLHFEGEITGYDEISKAIQANEQAALSSLTITVKVRFTNAKEGKQSFDRSFSASADFPSTQMLSDVEDRLVVDIVETLTENIFNAAVANW